MKKTFTIVVFVLAINNNLSAQTFLNGNFEITSAVGDQINLPNATFNSMISNTFAFGTYGDMDIIKSNTYCSFPQSASWYVALTGSGTDAISMQLSSPVISGSPYMISFYDEGCGSPYSTGASPVQIGVSTVNNNFGTLVYTGPLPTAGAWSNRTFSFVSPLTASYITVQLQSGGLSDWTQVDNFVISLAVLPVQLLSFKAHASDYAVDLSWSTASEMNNDFFIVERSADGKIFESIGKIKGAGNSNIILNYSFTDRYPLNGISYYRLKQTDFNGSANYSDIRDVTFNLTHDFSLHVFPNPASSETGIYYSLNSEQFTEVKVTNMYGREIATLVNETSSEGSHFIHLNTENFTTGIYLCELKTSSGRQVQKLQILK